MKRILPILSLFVVLLTATVFVFAQGNTLDLIWYTFDGGGGNSSGNDFVLNGTIGQTDAGLLSGDDFTFYGGFWQIDCPLPEAVVPSVAIVDSSIQLSWASNSNGFEIYRSINDPYFAPNTVYAADDASPWIDPDTDEVGNILENHTYLIRAVGNCGESQDSKRIGEFDFPIVPGG